MEPNMPQNSPPSPLVEPPNLAKPNPAPHTLIILLVVLALTLLGSTGYLAFQNYQLKKIIGKPSTSPFPTSSPATDSMTDWNTFKNNVYELKYPGSWKTSSETPAYPYYVQIAGGTIETGSLGTIQIQADSQKMVTESLNTWAKNTNQKVIGKRQIGSEDALIINMDGTDESIIRSYKYVFSHNNEFYIITTNNNYSASNDENKNPAKTFDQILSTFKFLE